MTAEVEEGSRGGWLVGEVEEGNSGGWWVGEVEEGNCESWLVGEPKEEAQATDRPRLFTTIKNKHRCPLRLGSGRTRRIFTGGCFGVYRHTSHEAFKLKLWRGT
jgi:hypothetical protein